MHQPSVLLFQLDSTYIIIYIHSGRQREQSPLKPEAKQSRKDGNVIMFKGVPLATNQILTLYAHDDLMGSAVHFPVYTW